MNTPTIIIAEPQPGLFSVSVSGKFGGGFQGVQKDRSGVLAMLALLKSYDCGEEPAQVVVPESLREELAAVFPQLRESFLHLKLPREEKAAMVRKANTEKKGLAEWARDALRRAAE